jgi:hypothetical protein
VVTRPQIQHKEALLCRHHDDINILKEPLPPCTGAGPFLYKEKKMATKVKVNRSAVTGKFVTEKYAKQHPKTTEKETVKKK